MTKEEKCRLPEDVKAECVAILRGNERRKWSTLPGNLRRLEAVQHARESIGQDLPEPMRAQLAAAIMQNCIDGRRFPYQRLGLSFVSRSDFYRRRSYFLYEMAVHLGIA